MSFVLGCFMLFFIWYATNVFLTKRKKEIGIYVFMGLTNQKIGKLYAIETIFLGLVALVLGVGFGIITSKLFVMITMAIS
ncbi:MAG: FtsX-like permease family protein [Thomasclavelia sp.]